MYLVGIDSSGEPEKKDTLLNNDPNSYFVISAVIMHEHYFLSSFKNNITNLISSFFNKQLEIHLKELTDLKRIKAMGFTFNRVNDFLDSLYDTIGKSDLVLFSVVIKKYPPRIKISKKEYRKNLLQTALQLLLERISKYFDKIKLLETNEYALLLVDESYYRQDIVLRDIIKNELKEGIYTSKRLSRNNIISNPLFYDSRDHILIQIADAVAFCVRRKFSKPIKSGFDFSKFFEKIENKFDKCNNNIIAGCGIKQWYFSGQ